MASATRSMAMLCAARRGSIPYSAARSHTAWAVQAHDGRIDVDSEMGRGSRFTIAVPAAGPPGADETLRDKLGDDPDEPRYIRTERGLGYRFVAPEHAR